MKTNTRWYPYPAQRQNFRLVDGTLLATPIKPDGTLDERETLAIDFDAAQFEQPVDTKYVTHADELADIKRDLEHKD